MPSAESNHRLRLWLTVACILVISFHFGMVCAVTPWAQMKAQVSEWYFLQNERTEQARSLVLDEKVYRFFCLYSVVVLASVPVLLQWVRWKLRVVLPLILLFWSPSLWYGSRTIHISGKIVDWSHTTTEPTVLEAELQALGILNHSMAPPDEKFLLVDTTVDLSTMGSPEDLRESLLTNREIQESTVDHFLELNQTPSKLSFPFPKPIQAFPIPKQELDQRFPDSADLEQAWKQFLIDHEEYYFGFFRGSRVGFNAEGTQGLVWVEHLGGPLVGRGGPYVLDRIGNQWGVQMLMVPHWVASRETRLPRKLPVSPG